MTTLNFYIFYRISLDFYDEDRKDETYITESEEESDYKDLTELDDFDLEMSLVYVSVHETILQYNFVMINLSNHCVMCRSGYVVLIIIFNCNSLFGNVLKITVTCTTVLILN